MYDDERCWDDGYLITAELDGFEFSEPIHGAGNDRGEARDRPLTFARRLSHAQLKRLGLLTGDVKRDQARAGILGAGIMAQQEGVEVSVSFNSNHYSGRARYAGSAYTYRTVKPAVRDLAERGWIKLTMAPVGPNAARGRQSTYILTDMALAAIGENPPLELHPGDPIRLKDTDKRLMPFDDTEFTRERRTQLAVVNQMLGSIKIGTRNSRIAKLPDNRWRLPSLVPDGRGGLRPRYVRSDARLVHVVHNNADWGQNGRMTGLFVQQLSKADRELLTIDNKSVVLLDFSCSHLVIAYAEAGLPLDRDAYAVPGWEGERSFLKRATNTALNCGQGRQQAINAIAHDLAVQEAKAGNLALLSLKSVRPGKPHKAKARAVLKAIEEYHTAIREAFYSGSGLRYMRKEADVMLATMLAAIAQNIQLLPVYDEFVVSEPDAADVRELMVQCWRELIGTEAMVRLPKAIRALPSERAVITEW